MRLTGPDQVADEDDEGDEDAADDDEDPGDLERPGGAGEQGYFSEIYAGGMDGAGKGSERRRNSARLTPCAPLRIMAHAQTRRARAP